MPTMSVQFRSISGTEAAAGWAGSHAVIVDRADGVAGGKGLGFNGGQLLGLAIGGCFCNDLHYAAHARGIRLSQVEVEVDITFEGDPPIATKARMRVGVVSEDSSIDVDALIRSTEKVSAVSNSLRRGVAVEIVAGPGGG